MQSSRHIAGHQSILVQVTLLVTQLVTDETWRIILLTGRIFTLSGLGLRAYFCTVDESYVPRLIDPRENGVDEMYALGVLMACCRQIRLLHMIPGQSPFLIMFQRFTATLLSVVQILLVVIASFLGGFFVLYYHQQMTDDDASPCPLNGQLAANNSLAAIRELGSELIMFAMNGEGDFGCAEMYMEVRAMATTMLVFFLGCVLLLVNALIAAMTKQFDEIWETQHVLVRCSRIVRLYQAESLKPLPPPFTILSLPYRIFSNLAPLCSSWKPAKTTRSVGSIVTNTSDLPFANGAATSPGGGKRGRRTTPAGSDPRHASTAPASLMRATDETCCEASLGGAKRLRRRSTCEQQVGWYSSHGDVHAADFRDGRSPARREKKARNARRSIGGSGQQWWSLEEDRAKRALWVAWRASMSEEECMEHVLNYVNAREDEVLEEGLWRTRFARKVHEDAAANLESLSALRDSNRALRENQQMLVRQQDETAREVAQRLANVERLLATIAANGLPAGAPTAGAPTAESGKGRASNPATVERRPASCTTPENSTSSRKARGSSPPVADAPASLRPLDTPASESQERSAAEGGPPGGRHVPAPVASCMPTGQSFMAHGESFMSIKGDHDELRPLPEEDENDDLAASASAYGRTNLETWQRLRRFEAAARALSTPESDPYGFGPEDSEMGAMVGITSRRAHEQQGSHALARARGVEGPRCSEGKLDHSSEPMAPPPVRSASDMGSDASECGPLGRESSATSVHSAAGLQSKQRERAEREAGLLQRLTRFSPAHRMEAHRMERISQSRDPYRRKQQRANWLMHRPLEGRELLKTSQDVSEPHDDDGDESVSSGTDGTSEEEEERISRYSCASSRTSQRS